MKNIIIILYFTTIFVALVSLTGCNSGGKINKVGMLVEHSINDQTWGEKGYNGLLQIKDKYNVDVFFKEEVKTQEEVNKAVGEFTTQGVNLIFGHSSIYGKYFNNIKENYPDIQFVYFNGAYKGDNLTSLHFNSNAMGFFAGMIAGKMTETNQVGIIGAYEWQPEIEGFYEGVSYQNPDATISMNFVNDWDNTERAIEIFSEMNNNHVDVFYPAGDSFSKEIIDRVRQQNKYAIGFVSDQSELGRHTVLTSTVQHVDKLYLLAAEKFDKGNLDGGIFTYDFEDEVISLGTFSPEMPNVFKRYIEDEIEKYTETGLLPNER